MTITIDLEDERRVRIADATVDARPPDVVRFEIAGNLRLGEEVLASAAGATLDPVRIAFQAADRAVAIDLRDRDEAALRLDAADVGLAAPDADDIVPDTDALGALATDGRSAPRDLAAGRPGVVAFTVEGRIVDAPTDAVTVLAETELPPSPKSITFEGLPSIRSDGGAVAPVLETTLLGFGIVVYRDGRISIGPDPAGRS